MSLAALIRDMAAAGASPEAIAIAVEAIERAQAQAQSHLVERRAKDAERTRRYRERGGGKIPDAMRAEVFERDDFTCCECGSTEYLQCDHVHPVSAGGETSLENLQTLCRVCNARKRDRIRKRNVRGNSADTSGHSAETPAPAPSPLPPPCTPHQPHAPTPTREGNPARTRKGGTWPCPDGIDPQHWADLQANRRAKRMALTPTALEHQLRQIEKFTSDEWPPGRIVQHAAAKGWAAIHDPREPHENRNGKRPHNDDRPRSRGLLGAVLDAEHDSRAGFGF